jgi:phosphate transport system permease protein
MTSTGMDQPRTQAPGAGPAGPRTRLPVRAARGARPPQPRQVGVLRAGDVLSVFGAAAAAFCTTVLLWTQVGFFSGILGMVVVTWCLFVAYYAAVVSMEDSGPVLRDKIAVVVVQSLAVLVLFALGAVIYYTFHRGWPAFFHLNMYTQDLGTANSQAPLTKGGVLHGIIGTLIELGIAMGFGVPFGLLAAVFMREVPGPFSRFVRTVVNAMTALPDIVAGLFIYATLILTLGLNFCGLAASIALAVTIVPIICRASDVVLGLVPGGLTEASYALGASQWRTVRLVTLPTARSGLATAMILGAARAVGETAPVLLTAGATNVINYDPLHYPMMSLPLLAYLLATSGQPNYITRGFATAGLLLIVVLVLFIIARAIGGRGPGQLSAGQMRRRAARSRRDLERFARRAEAARPYAGGPGVDPLYSETAPGEEATGRDVHAIDVEPGRF